MGRQQSIWTRVSFVPSPASVKEPIWGEPPPYPHEDWKTQVKAKAGTARRHPPAPPWRASRSASSSARQTLRRTLSDRTSGRSRDLQHSMRSNNNPPNQAIVGGRSASQNVVTLSDERCAQGRRTTLGQRHIIQTAASTIKKTLRWLSNRKHEASLDEERHRNDGGRKVRKSQCDRWKRAKVEVWHVPKPWSGLESNCARLSLSSKVS
jgi:hypothetical protein